MRADSFLDQKNLEYELVEQDKPTKACDAAAEERGLETSQIVKSLILERDGEIFHVCLPGDRTLSEKRFGEHRLVDPEKSAEITGQESGTVHPFSSDIKHFFDERIFENDIVSFTAGTETEAIKIEPENLRKAIEASDFEFEISDLVVSNEAELQELKQEGLEEQDAKFIAEKGYRSLYFSLESDFDQSRIVKLLLEIKRHDLDFSDIDKSEVLDRADSETHLQKLVEHMADEGELPEKQEFDLEDAVDKVIEDNPDAVQDLKDGRDSSINYLIGQIMQQSNGKADPDKAKKMMKEEILE